MSASNFKNFCEGNQSRIVQVIECRETDITPVPSTVVPVTQLHSFENILKNVLKRRHSLEGGTPFRHWRTKVIHKFNDWIRSYCGENDLSFLDLEAAVRVSERNRYLRGGLAKLDGLPLMANAHGLLDQIVIAGLYYCIRGGRNVIKKD